MNKKQLKSNIRQQIREKRQALTAKEIEVSGKQLIQQIEKHQLLIPHQHIACFLSFDGEIDTSKVIQTIWKKNKLCYLPKLVLKNQSDPNHLLFLPYTQSSKMKSNHYGIPEVNDEVTIDIAQLDLVLFPLVAFDKSCNRLGMGGGFYDATFTSLKKQQNRPKFIGLAHDFQQVERLPNEEWDIPLDGICTATQFIKF